jgi:hypothetical protein
LTSPLTRNLPLSSPSILTMDSKYCSMCACKQTLSCFLADATANPQSKVFSTCIQCRARLRKRRAVQGPSQPASSPLPTPLPESRLLRPLPQPILPAYILPDEQYWYVQAFNTAIAAKREPCLRCQEEWFAIDLKDHICCICSLQDKADKQSKPKKTLFRLCTNNIDLGELYLEAIVHCYHGYRFYYTGYYVSLLQNTTLDVIVLQPFDPRQLQYNFHACKGRVMTWHRFLKNYHHNNYQYISISPDRLNALLPDPFTQLC